MRVITAVCSAIYSGRGDTMLRSATRAIIIKQDGSVSLHNDVSNKPLNYMGKGGTFTVTDVDDGELWVWDARKESLQVLITEVLSDVEFDLDPGVVPLERDGTEKHLQSWLAENVDVFGAGMVFKAREYATGAGPVDLLLEDADGAVVAVEVKRVASPNAVYQVKRYVDALKESLETENIIGVVAAVDLRPAMKVLAEKRGIVMVQIPPEWNHNVNRLSYLPVESASEENDDPVTQGDSFV